MLQTRKEPRPRLTELETSPALRPHIKAGELVVREHALSVREGNKAREFARREAALAEREDALARRVTGNMSSRPSWTAMHACGDIAV